MVSMSSLKHPSEPSPSKTSPPSPSLDKDSPPPKRSVFQRLCSSLILFSFLFQTLWPSMAFSMEGPVDVLRPVSPRSFFGPSPSEDDVLQEEGRIAFGIQVDDKDGDFDSASKKPLAFVPIGRSFAQTQKLIDESLSLQELYPSLKVQADGLSWTQFGYSFLFHTSGNLFVFGKDVSKTRDSTLRLYNPHGDVILSENLALRHLLVKGQNVIQKGKNAIERLDIWAMGAADTPGAFMNLDEASLRVGELYLRQGHFENHGALSVSEGGIIDGLHQNCINYGTLYLASGAKIVHANLFHNLGSVSGTSYSINGKTLTNQQTMEGEQITLVAEEKVQNSGRIASTLKTEITSLGSLENKGNIVSAGEQTLAIHKTLVNAGSMTASRHSLQVLGQTYNSGSIKGEHSLVLDLNEGVNSGDITSEGDADVTIRGVFVNQKSMVAKGRHKLTLSNVFVNSLGAHILGERAFETFGDGLFDNYGSVSSTGVLELHNRSFVNHNLIHSHGPLLLALGEKFTNKGTGSVIVEGLTTIEGGALIENEAATVEDAGIGFKKGVHFHNFQGTLLNAGLFNSGTTLWGEMKRLVNRGTFGANLGYSNLQILDFFQEETGTMLGGGSVSLKGINRGQWHAGKLELDLLGEFSHGQGSLNVTDSLSTKGIGSFLVHAPIKGPKVFINNSHFENFSEWIQGQMVVRVGPHVTTWRNGNISAGNKRAAMVVKEITFERSSLSGSQRLNAGTLKADLFVNEHASFHNKADMTLGRWQQRGSTFVNHKGGVLDVRDLTEIQTDTLGNEGQITLRGVIQGRLDTLLNKDRLTLEGPATLTGIKLINKGSFKALGLFDWSGETLDNFGEMRVCDNHIQARRQIINRNLIRWTHNSFRAWHILNMGLLERTDKLDSAISGFEVSKDQSTLFKKGTAENRGTIRTVTTYKPRMDIKHKGRFAHWHNSGTLKLQRLKLDAESFTNTGTLGVKEDITGRVDSFENTGEIEASDITLTGRTFINQQSIKARNSLTYRGKAWQSTMSSVLESTGSLEIRTSDPLKLYGQVRSVSGSTFSAPTIDNYATLRTERGVAEFKGILANHGHLDGDELRYEGPSLVNSGKLEANLYRRASPLHSLINQVGGEIIIRAGGFSIHNLTNRGKLQLHKGIYRFNAWDNADGEADMDGFAIDAQSFTLRGKLDVNQWVDSTVPYQWIYNRGQTVIRSGTFHTDTITNYGTLSLGKGHYKAKLFRNDWGAHFIALGGMRFSAKDIDNDGEITSPTSLGVEALHRYKKLGKVKVKKDLIVKIPKGVEASSLLVKHHKTWTIGGKVSVEGGEFRNTGEITLPNPVSIKTTHFTNKGSFSSKGLTLEAESVANGESNTAMGTLKIYGPLTVTSRGDVDNRFGIIESTQKIKVKSEKGSILVGAPVVEGRSKRKNEAKIATRGELDFESVRGSIFTSYGTVYGQEGLRFKALQKIRNQTGSISADYNIYLDAEEIENILGDMWTTEVVGYAFQILGMFDAVRVDTYDEHVESDPAEVLTTRGNIYITTRKGLNRGSSILSPYGVYINGRKVKEGDSLPSGFLDEAGDFYTRYITYSCKPRQNPERCGNWTRAQDFVRQSFVALIKGGKEVRAKTGFVTITGSVEGGTVTIEADRLEAKNTSGSRTTLPQTKFIIDLGEVARIIAKSSSLLKDGTSDGKGIRTALPGDDRPLPDTFRTALSRSVGSASVPDLLGPQVLRFTFMYALAEYLGTLNVFGKTGDELMGLLLKRSQQRAREQGKEGQLISKSRLESFDEGMLVEEIEEVAGHLYRVYKLLVTPEMVNPYGNSSGAITGNKVHMLVKESVSMTDAVVQAWDSKDEAASSVPEKKTTGRSEGAPVPFTMDKEEDPSSSEVPPPLPTTTEEPAVSIRCTEGDITFDGGLMGAETGGVKVEAPAGSNTFLGVQVTTQGGVGITAGVHNRFESKAVRLGNAENYQDERVLALLRGKTILMESGLDTVLKGVQTQSKQSTIIKAGRDLFDIPLAIARQSLKRDGRNMTRDKYVYQQASDHTSEGTFATIVGGSQDHYAVHVRAKLIRFLGQGSINFHEVHDEEEHESVRNTTSRGLFGSKSKTVHASSSAAHSKKGYLKSENPIEVVSRSSDVTACNTTFDTPKTILKALKGRVRILLGTEYSSSSRSERSSNLLWQRMSQRIEEHKTYIPCLFTGSLEIHSSETVVESVRGQTLDWINRIDQHGGRIVHDIAHELHRVESHTVQGPTAACSALIALAATIATYGTGSWLGGAAISATSATGASAAVISSMTAAAFSSLSAQAAIALVTHQGNIGRAAESLANQDVLRSMALAMATAGIIEGIGLKFNLPKSGKEASGMAEFASKAEGLAEASYGQLFSAHLLKEGLNLGVNVGVRTATGGRFEDLLKAGGLVALSSALGGVFALKIGDAHYTGEINTLSHKTLHALSGGVQGLIVRGEKGITAGALGALVAETVADVMTPTGGLGVLRASERPTYSADRIRLTQAVARLTAATAALLAGMDEQSIAIAISTATIAVENNFAKSAERVELEAVEEEDESADVDTDDEAEQSTLGKARKVYTDPLDEGAEAIGLDKAAELAGTYAKSFEGGESGYVDAKLAEAERLSGKSLTSAERTMLSEAFTEAYRDESTALHMMEGAGVITQIPGKCVDWFLRYTGLTDKGTARAAGHIVNDAFVATGVGVVGKAVVKSTVRTVGKGLGKGAPKTTALPKEIKSYVREVESKSGLRVHPKQQEMLAKDLRENRYSKIEGEALKMHQAQYKAPGVRVGLIREWEAQTGQKWPRYSQPVYKKDGSIFKKIGDPYDAHHINPQQIKGQHQWWNMHPTPVDQHQGGIHGSGSKLNDILKSLGKK